MPEQYVPSFGEFLRQLAMTTFDKGYIRKKPFRKEWVVPLGAPVVVGGLVFQSSALLGHARLGHADALARLNHLERNDAAISYADSLSEMVRTWLGKQAREPETLHEVWNLAQFPSMDLRDLQTMMVLNKSEIRLRVLIEQVNLAAIYGIAFGLSYPADFERLWRLTFETMHDPDAWTEARSHGLAIPERQELYPLATAQVEALNQAAGYVRAYRPELLEPLDLTDYGKG